ncbi:helix-turn-helix domain-containing protein [Micromonospora sp. WMMA1363]|uniref:helix-turn-helix domain-containing protein n=1 Tax=Micromonospora sp. WMMA1363 TaxID=3053985 RepID=UPI00338E6561
MRVSWPCVNSDLWTSDNDDDLETAKDRCLDCPLQQYQACQETGWRHEYGVWGGLSHRDRERLDPLRYARLIRDSRRCADATDRSITSQRDIQISPTVREGTVRARGLDMAARGMTSARVAATLGVSPATVRSWIHRAKAS